MIRRAHTIRAFGRPYHPYFLMLDLSMLLGFGVGLVFSVVRPGMTVVGWVIVFLIELLVYQGYLLLKERLFGIASRSFLQDTIFFLLPSYTLSSLLVGHDLSAAADAVGLMFPVVLGTTRLGCFLGGCCYGRPATWGVRYPASVFQIVRTWRTYTPGASTADAVIPVPLFEAGVNYALFAGLSLALSTGETRSGAILPLYFAGYCTWRLLAEKLRGTRHRPKWGPFSQAQWISMILIPLCYWFAFAHLVP